MMLWFMSRCHNKDILNNVIFAIKMSLLSERQLMTETSRHMSYHGSEGVMSVLCTPLQVKCYHLFYGLMFPEHSRNQTLLAGTTFQAEKKLQTE